MEEQDNDTYVKVYDIDNPPYKHKHHITNFLYYSKLYSNDYVNCVQQNGRNYGFLPLNDLMVYTGKEVLWSNVPSVIEAHKIIRTSAVPNFMGARIPVSGQLNINAWKYYPDTSKYWDKQIVDLLQYGFPLDFDHSRTLEATHVNHSSALKFPEHVNSYIESEMKYGAILGPFEDHPFHCHIYRFLTREKLNSSNRRVILDLSFPVGKSVNDGVAKDKYLNTYFELNYSFVDTVVNSLKALGTETLLYKIDISHAFRHIRIDPGDLDLLGLKHEQLFIDCTLLFSFRHGSVFFQRCTDAIQYILKHQFQFPYLFPYNYIDDLIYAGLPANIYESYTTLIKVLQDLGLEISPSKLVPPTTRAICLGIETDMVNRTLKIPTEKLHEVQDICRIFTSKSKAAKNQ